MLFQKLNLIYRINKEYKIKIKVQLQIYKNKYLFKSNKIYCTINTKSF